MANKYELAWWMSKALEYKGVTEIQGSENNTTVMKFHKASKWWGGGDSGESNSWCGSYVTYVIKNSQILDRVPGYAFRAKSWKKFGKKISNPVFGAIAIKDRNGGGHVGFVYDVKGKYTYLLSGNDGNKVRIRKTLTSEYTDFRLPKSVNYLDLKKATKVRGIQDSGQYKVKPGDTLSEIAKNNNMSLNDLVELNGFPDSSVKIMVGQKLKIIGKYTVKSGDTLSEIAKDNRISLYELVKLNGLPNHKVTIKVGQILEIYSSGSNKPSDKQKSLKSKTGLHIVKSGDNLYRIAINNNMTLDELVKLNGFPDHKVTISAGQKLKIYSSGSNKPSDKQKQLKSKTGLHIVKTGDNLYRIAINNNMTLDELVKLNGFPDHKVTISAGQKLKVYSSGSNKPFVKNSQYIFKEGDNLYQMAKLNGVPHKILVKFIAIDQDIVKMVQKNKDFVKNIAKLSIGVEGTSWLNYFDTLGKAEGANQYSIKNKLGFTGIYQGGKVALKGINFFKKIGPAIGINNIKEYQYNPIGQEASALMWFTGLPNEAGAFRSRYDYTKISFKKLKDLKSFNELQNETFTIIWGGSGFSQTFTVNAASITTAAHLVGQGNLSKALVDIYNQWKKNDSKTITLDPKLKRYSDSNKITFATYMELFDDFNLEPLITADKVIGFNILFEELLEFRKDKIHNFYKSNNKKLEISYDPDYHNAIEVIVSKFIPNFNGSIEDNKTIVLDPNAKSNNKDQGTLTLAWSEPVKDAISPVFEDNIFLADKGTGYSEFENMPNYSTDNKDSVIFGKDIEKSDITFIQDEDDLLVKYGKKDQFAVIGQSNDAKAIEEFRISDGSFITSDSIERIIQEMSVFATENDISLTHNTIKNNETLMQIVTSGWQNI